MTSAINVVLRALAAFALALSPLIVAAHGLLLDVESDGDAIFGTAYYTNGDKAVSESVALLDLSVSGSAPIRARTDAAGVFRFDAIRDHRYRVSVYGEEGHTVDVELVAEPKSLPKLIETETAAASSLWPPPAWAIIGGALLLSLVPAIVLRKRKPA